MQIAKQLWRTAIFATCLAACTCALAGQPGSTWEIGTPIVTYWAGPSMTDAVAQQMAEGGFNVVWCEEGQLDLVHAHGLRAMLVSGLLAPGTLDDPDRRSQLDELIARVKGHPALYCYFITDEPSAAAFPALGRLVAYLREKDPAHMAYINLFPTYASNEQLGTQGDTVTAYAEHLRQYLEVVKPDLISYDHYHFGANGDGNQYFLNLGMIRRAALDAGLPFLNIVQACSWTPAMRVPNGDEVRWLVYTSLAYGAQGISYYVYCHPGHVGAIANDDGTPTPLYYDLCSINREFAAIATELQPLTSLGAFHQGPVPWGAEGLPEDAPFRVEPPPGDGAPGYLLGYFGTGDMTSHVVMVNLDYKAGANITLVGPGDLDLFDAKVPEWVACPTGPRAQLQLPPGGGYLVRLAQPGG